MKKAELELADQVIQSLVGEWRPEDFENEYRRDLKAMLEAKLAGEVIARPEPVAETPVVDLMEALRQQRRRRAGPPRRWERARPEEDESRPEERLSSRDGAGAQERLTPEVLAA